MYRYVRRKLKDEVEYDDNAVDPIAIGLDEDCSPRDSKRIRRFRSQWKGLFDWIEERNGASFCKVCEKELCNNKTNLKRHETLSVHKKRSIEFRKTQIKLDQSGDQMEFERSEIVVHTSSSDMLEIKYKLTGETLKINTFWLRDHCRCLQCYNQETKQRTFNLLDLSPDVHPLTCYYSKDELGIEVTWSDGHVSTYDLKFIYDSQLQQLIKRETSSSVRIPWNRAIVLQNKQHLHISLAQLVSSERAVYQVVESLVRYGIAFVDKIPPNTAMTEMAVRRVFPVMKTLFGEMYTFSDVPDHADTAYSKQHLGSHTDNTYFCDAAGLQALHCLRHEGGDGGENFFVDGLHAALELKERNPHAFDLLTRVHVPAEYIEKDEHHKYSAPMIRLNPLTGEIIQLRLNVYDRAVFDTLPQQEMREFYDSFREFLSIVKSSENCWTLKLHPGTMVIFDNWRMFHGRCAYTGLRTMTGCYVQRTDFLSKARFLGIID